MAFHLPHCHLNTNVSKYQRNMCEERACGAHRHSIHGLFCLPCLFFVLFCVSTFPLLRQIHTFATLISVPVPPQLFRASQPGSLLCLFPASLTSFLPSAAQQRKEQRLRKLMNITPGLLLPALSLSRTLQARHTREPQSSN